MPAGPIFAVPTITTRFDLVLIGAQDGEPVSPLIIPAPASLAARTVAPTVRLGSLVITPAPASLAAATVNPTIPGDTTAPIVSSVAASETGYLAKRAGVAGAIVTVTSLTDELASSIVDWDTDTGTPYANSTTEADTSPRVLSHSVPVTVPSAQVAYFFRPRSRDAALNAGNGAEVSVTTRWSPYVKSGLGIWIDLRSDTVRASGATISTLTDFGPNGLTITTLNGAAYDPLAFGSAPGATFDGTNDSYGLPNDANLNLMGGAFVIAGVTRLGTTAPAVAYELVNIKNGTSTRVGLRVNASGLFEAFTEGLGSFTAFAHPTLLDDAPHAWIVQRDASNVLSLDIDGGAYGTISGATSTLTTMDGGFVGCSASSARFFKGWIESLAIYKATSMSSGEKSSFFAWAA